MPRSDNAPTHTTTAPTRTATIIAFPTVALAKLRDAAKAARKPKKRRQTAAQLAAAKERKAATLRRRVERGIAAEIAREAWRDLFYEATEIWPTAPRKAVEMLIAGSTFPVRRSTFWALAEQAFPEVDGLIVDRLVDGALAELAMTGVIVIVPDLAAYDDVVTVHARPVARRYPRTGSFKYVEAWPTNGDCDGQGGSAA